MNLKWKTLLAALTLLLIISVPAFAIYSGLPQFDVPEKDVDTSGATITCHHTSSSTTYYADTPFLGTTCNNAVMTCYSTSTEDSCKYYHVLGTVTYIDEKTGEEKEKEYMHRYIFSHRTAAIKEDENGNQYINCNWQCKLCGGKAKGADWAKDLIRHNYDGEYESEKPATCIVPMQRLDKCNNGCGNSNVIEVGEPDPNAHTFREYKYDYNNDATCTTDGTKTAPCAYHKDVTNTIPDPKHPALNHDTATATRNEAADVAATCMAPAQKAYTCNRVVNDVVCGETFYVPEGDTVPCNMVKDEEQSYDATCTKPGLTVTVCSYRCGASESETIKAKGHKEKTSYGYAATCTEDGLTSGTYCGRCRTVLESQYVIPAKGHSSVTDKAVAPTCTTTGLTEGSHCSVCSETLVKQETVPAKGHSPAIDAAVAPTCTETGLTEGNHCSVCSEVLLAQQVVDALGHNHRGKVVEPSCTEGGYTRYSCTRCEDSYKAKHTDAIGHWYGLWTDNGDNTHSAACQREKCGHIGTAPCQYVEIAINEEIVKLCVVCDETIQIVLIDAIGESVDPQINLPAGELVVRSINAPFENVLCAFTVAYEYTGVAQPFNGMVRISIPAEQLPENFTLMRVVVTEATETTERTEEWVKTDYVCEDGMISFEIDSTALFVLTNAE